MKDDDVPIFWSYPKETKYQLTLDISKGGFLVAYKTFEDFLLKEF